MLPDPPIAFVIVELPSDPESDDELQLLPQRPVMTATMIDKTNDRRLPNISTPSSSEWYKPSAAERIIRRFALANINALLQIGSTDLRATRSACKQSVTLQLQAIS